MQPYEKVHADNLGKHKRAPTKHEWDTGKRAAREADKIIFLYVFKAQHSHLLNAILGKLLNLFKLVFYFECRDFWQLL